MKTSFTWFGCSFMPMFSKLDKMRTFESDISLIDNRSSDDMSASCDSDTNASNVSNVSNTNKASKACNVSSVSTLNTAIRDSLAITSRKAA